jgi:hypothetical protein
MRENCLENEGQLSKGISFTVKLKSSLTSDGSGYNLADAIANDAGIVFILHMFLSGAFKKIDFFIERSMLRQTCITIIKQMF